MPLPSQKICRRICQLHARLGSPHAPEAQTAHKKLTELLASHGLTWNDLPAILALSVAPPPPPPPPDGGPEINVLDLTLDLLAQHVILSDAQRMMVALWSLHSSVFDRFAVTPRLALLSPVRGCGKTLLMMLLELLAAYAHRSDSVTPAWIYHTFDRHPGTTLLADEGDNLGLFDNRDLRAVFNSGHRRGGTIDRFIAGQPRSYQTFTPLAVAAIGMLPLPLLHRCIIAEMRRPTRSERARLKLFDGADPVFPAARQQIAKWAATCRLAPEPAMPDRLGDRAADNCRVLFAIADDLGHGEAARAAALELAANRPDEDPGITGLIAIWTVFTAHASDRIASDPLVRALRALDDTSWHNGELTQGRLAQLLRPFGIRPQTVRPEPQSDTRRGYYRKQFLQAWASYCDIDDTATQASEIKRLRVVPGDT